MSQRLSIKVNQVFGKLKVIKEEGRSLRGDILYLCKCDCGNETIAKAFQLKRGDKKTCGHCIPSNKYSILGNEVFVEMSNNISFIIDIDDLEEVKKYQWHCDNFGYVRTMLNNKQSKLHRMVMKAKKGVEVDHINLNPLDNRKGNLRICTHQQNMWNQRLRKTNTSGFIGVRKMKKYHKYTAEIRIKGKNIYLGCFNTIEEAVEVRDYFALKHRGEFATLNLKNQTKKNRMSL